MHIHVSRFSKQPTATVGRLTVDGQFECYTLEDVVRARGQPKVWGRTAIPSGTYEVIINFSTRFQQLMPLLLHVPGYEGVRIHPGNTAADTAGCLLTGRAVDPSAQRVFNSRLAYQALFQKLQQSTARGEAISLTIE